MLKDIYVFTSYYLEFATSVNKYLILLKAHFLMKIVNKYIRNIKHDLVSHHTCLTDQARDNRTRNNSLSMIDTKSQASCQFYNKRERYKHNSNNFFRCSVSLF